MAILIALNQEDAIESFQKHYKLEDTGILSKEEQNDLLYMHDLLKNYKLIERNFNDSSNKKVSKLFKAIDKLEKRIIDRGDNGFFSAFSGNNYLTDKLKKSRVVIKKEEKDKKIHLAEQRAKNTKKYTDNGDGTVTNKTTKLM